MFKTRFRDSKIHTKFNLFLILAIVIGLLLSSAVLWRALEQRAEAEITSKAAVLMRTMSAVRNYTADRVNPLLVGRLKTEAIFTPEAIPTFAVREVFEYFRKDPGYEDFFFKDAAPNPTNLRDQADDFETQLVEEFRNQRSTEKTGWRDLPEGKTFYVARPLAVTKQKCLQCHSTPDIAPKSLLTTYGSQHGFGWKHNQIVAAQIIYVPAGDIFTSTRRSFVITLGVFIGTLVFIVLLINFLLKRTVIRRIQKMAKTAQAVSMGEMNIDFKEDSKDEIGLLALAFNRMKSSLEASIKLLSQRKGN
ncbi:MAG: DUF3365 domain-containing protein [Kovacikia sp.]